MVGFFGRKKYRVKDRYLLSFTKSMYYLIKGKVELLDSLNLVSVNYNGEFKEKIIQAKKLIEKGRPLNKAFEKIVSDKEFLGLIKIGEQTGNLETVFKNLYEKYRFREKIRKDIRGLSIYPVTVIITAIIIVTVLLKFVVPKFALVYSDMGQQLPFITKIVVKFSEFFNKYSLIMTILLISLIWITIHIKNHNKRKLEKILLSIPISGKIYKDIKVLNFTGNMYFLTSAGIPFLKSLKMCRNSDSSFLNSEIRKIVTRIEKGENIRKSFYNLSFFRRKIQCFFKFI
ncbi:MAG: type II secretion system F family protein [Leptotrichiaceae bacterium]|nr:type II secretion system F family protein [Leptotrichiaceae bacterium]